MNLKFLKHFPSIINIVFSDDLSMHSDAIKFFCSRISVYAFILIVFCVYVIISEPPAISLLLAGFAIFAIIWDALGCLEKYIACNIYQFSDTEITDYEYIDPIWSIYLGWQLLTFMGLIKKHAFRIYFLHEGKTLTQEIMFEKKLAETLPTTRITVFSSSSEFCRPIVLTRADIEYYCISKRRRKAIMAARRTKCLQDTI